jgi:hypothetical protein
MHFRIAVLLVVLFLPLVAYAGSGGEKTMRFGFMPEYTLYQINDPDGPTKQGANFSALSGIVIFDQGRDTRIFVHAATNYFKIPASTTNIGQSVKQTGIEVSYQKVLRVTRTIKPWLGVGLGYETEKYTNRYTLTPGGHLAQQFSDRSVESYPLVLTAAHQWKYDNDFDYGLHFQFAQPLTSDGARSLGVALYVVY